MNSYSKNRRIRRKHKVTHRCVYIDKIPEYNIYVGHSKMKELRSIQRSTKGVLTQGRKKKVIYFEH